MKDTLFTSPKVVYMDTSYISTASKAGPNKQMFSKHIFVVQFGDIKVEFETDKEFKSMDDAIQEAKDLMQAAL